MFFLLQSILKKTHSKPKSEVRKVQEIIIDIGLYRTGKDIRYKDKTGKDIGQVIIDYRNCILPTS